MNTRETVVAGQFYPQKQQELEEIFKTYNTLMEENIKDKNILTIKSNAIIVPHAGYIYSGFTANIAFRLLKNFQPKTIVVIGPSHHVYLDGTSISLYDSYETPLGKISINKTLSNNLVEKFNLKFFEDAHSEHSTEVQMPFIKNYLPSASVIELIYGKESSENLSKIIEFILENPNNAVVISTDLSHYYNLNKANALDNLCLKAIEELNPQKLQKNCEACGKIGITAMLMYAKKKKLEAKLLDYRTSADANGDKTQVVGYASVAFV
ncbi:MAG: AmmeMemoRadiSam system protein B [Epsilonproteobacteria bacterium]|nr:AmmeMemoRadiSam system protein B [Campylobacterota bacterium]